MVLPSDGHGPFLRYISTVLQRQHKEPLFALRTMHIFHNVSWIVNPWFGAWAGIQRVSERLQKVSGYSVAWRVARRDYAQNDLTHCSPIARGLTANYTNTWANSRVQYADWPVGSRVPKGKGQPATMCASPRLAICGCVWLLLFLAPFKPTKQTVPTLKDHYSPIFDPCTARGKDPQSLCPAQGPASAHAAVQPGMGPNGLTRYGNMTPYVLEKQGTKASVWQRIGASVVSSGLRSCHLIVCRFACASCKPIWSYNIGLTPLKLQVLQHRTYPIKTPSPGEVSLLQPCSRS